VHHLVYVLYALWYWLIQQRHFFYTLLSMTYVRAIYLGYNNIASHRLQHNIPRSELFWEFNYLIALEKAGLVLFEVAI
jgi:hypothetical protein